MRRTGRSSPTVAIVAGLVASVIFFGLMLRRVDLAIVQDQLTRVSIPVLGLALLTRGGAFLALALRSRVTVAPAQTVALPRMLLSHLLGFTGNNVLPFRLGEIIRIDYLARTAGLSRSFLVGSVGVERLLDMIVLLVFFALTVPTVLGRSSLEGSFAVISGMTVLALIAVVAITRRKGLARLLIGLLSPLSPRLAERMAGYTERLVDGLTSLSDARWAPAAVGTTLLYWLCAAGSIRIVLAAFGLELRWYAPFLVIAVTALGTALPSSPGFVGTYHYFSSLGVRMLGVDASTAASFAIVAHAVAFVPYTLLGLVVFARSIRVWWGDNLAKEAEAAHRPPGSDR